FTAVQNGNSGQVTAFFRDTNGSIRNAQFPLATIINGFGVFASDPAAAQDSQGKTFIAVRDTFNAIWLSEFDSSGNTWNAWQYGAGVFQGNPAVAAANGTAWIAGRDQYNSYWLNHYNGAWSTWTPLAGIFSTDPAMTSCADGSVYIVGKDTFNSLWSGH